MTVIGVDEEYNNGTSLLGNNKPTTVKVQIVPSHPKSLSHLPARPAVNLAFHNLTYRVKEGRKNSKLLIEKKNLMSHIKHKIFT